MILMYPWFVFICDLVWHFGLIGRDQLNSIENWWRTWHFSGTSRWWSDVSGLKIQRILMIPSALPCLHLDEEGYCPIYIYRYTHTVLYILPSPKDLREWHMSFFFYNLMIGRTSHGTMRWQMTDVPGKWPTFTGTFPPFARVLGGGLNHVDPFMWETWCR